MGIWGHWTDSRVLVAVILGGGSRFYESRLLTRGALVPPLGLALEVGPNSCLTPEGQRDAPAHRPRNGLHRRRNDRRRPGSRGYRRQALVRLA